ncbi:MAG: hypothetical protein LIV24_01980 [Eubacterium sp.]|nr:hypothetical protein [Eubacterium sp.]
MTEHTGQKWQQDKMQELIRFLDEQKQTISEYDDALTRRLVENVYVETATSFRVKFKSGTEVEV